MALGFGVGEGVAVAIGVTVLSRKRRRSGNKTPGSSDSWLVRRAVGFFVSAAVTTLAALAALAPAAGAHVTVNPTSAPAGEPAILSFVVPNEEDAASTVKVEIDFDQEHPIPFVAVQPVAGWTSKVSTVQLAKPITTDDGTVTSAVSQITWTGGPLKAGEFQQFTISADPLPAGIDTLVFKAIQTYDNGDVVRWIDVVPKGQPEPEHPAPQLTLTASTPNESGSSSDTTARVLGIVGIAVGVVGVAVAAVALLAGCRRTAQKG
jgi:uncharacterized protein YcnI